MLNKCNFHLRFRVFFSLILSENAPNVDFREAKFQNFPGDHAPGPPTVLTPLALQPILAGPTLNCFCRACEKVMRCVTHAQGVCLGRSAIDIQIYFHAITFLWHQNF